MFKKDKLLYIRKYEYDKKRAKYRVGPKNMELKRNFLFPMVKV